MTETKEQGKHTPNAERCYLEVRGCFGPLTEKDAENRICPLHAAAPDLLELLIEMREELSSGPTGGNDYHDAWEVFGERIEAAIARAEGRQP